MTVKEKLALERELSRIAKNRLGGNSGKILKHIEDHADELDAYFISKYGDDGSYVLFDADDDSFLDNFFSVLILTAGLKELVSGEVFPANVKLFENAAVLAYEKELKTSISRFRLSNDALLQSLEDRSKKFYKTHKRFYKRAKSVVRKNFIEKGRNPFESGFLREVQAQMNYTARWQARRFSITETGIIGNQAQNEVFERAGVETFTWRTGVKGKRHDNMGLHGQRRGPTGTYTVGVYHPKYPQDPILPARHVISCHCFQGIEIPDDITKWQGDT